MCNLFASGARQTSCISENYSMDRDAASATSLPRTLKRGSHHNMIRSRAVYILRRMHVNSLFVAIGSSCKILPNGPLQQTGEWWQAGRRPQIVGRALSPEIERAFFERINVADHQDHYETEHAPEDDAALFDRVSVKHRPGIHENNFEIEKDKEHRDEIKLHTESRMSFALRNHPAFVRSIFCWCAFAGFAYQDTNEQRRSGEQNRYDDLQENWQIFVQHPGTLPKPIRRPAPLTLRRQDGH